MLNLTRWAAATALASLMVLPAFAASPSSPAGSWVSTDGQARVRVSLCGDGTELCAKLVGLAGQARTPKNLGLLNSYVVDRAQPADANVWQGTVHFNGETASGAITLESANVITVRGCQLGMCKTFEFNRI